MIKFGLLLVSSPLVSKLGKSLVDVLVVYVCGLLKLSVGRHPVRVRCAVVVDEVLVDVTGLIEVTEVIYTVLTDDVKHLSGFIVAREFILDTILSNRYGVVSQILK